MSKQIETGGQAFPRAGFEVDTRYGKPHDGMTLRDYFAAKAMQSLVQAIIVSGHYSNEQTNIASIASIAYEHADAMLAEREKGRQVEAVTGEECAEPKSDGWISVNDRLPDDGQECIVFLKDLIPEVLDTDWSRVTVDYFEGGKWPLEHPNESIVTHWQPMPLPPKKGGAEIGRRRAKPWEVRAFMRMPRGDK